MKTNSLQCPVDGKPCKVQAEAVRASIHGLESVLPREQVCDHCRQGAERIDALSGTRLGMRSREMLRRMRDEGPVTLTIDGNDPTSQSRTHKVVSRLHAAGLVWCGTQMEEAGERRMRKHWGLSWLGTHVAEILDHEGWDKPIRWHRHLPKLRERLLLPLPALVEKCAKERDKHARLIRIIAGT